MGVGRKREREKQRKTQRKGENREIIPLAGAAVSAFSFPAYANAEKNAPQLVKRIQTPEILTYAAKRRVFSDIEEVYFDHH